MKIALGVNTLITLLKFKNFSFSLTLLLVITHLKKKTVCFLCLWVCFCFANKSICTIF